MIPSCLTIPRLRPAARKLGMIMAIWLVPPGLSGQMDDALMTSFRKRVAPVLDQYCFDCHGFGASKGGLVLDEFTTADALLSDPSLWFRVLKKTRAGLMPPADEPQPTPAEIVALGEWIKRDLFRIDPVRTDPGAVTLRRLNQVEYRNTIRDLTGARYDTAVEFPPDDTGEGFDVIGEALNISPLLLEKYLDAAQQIVTEAVMGGGFGAFVPAGWPAELPAPGLREAYARKMLEHFGRRAFRRPLGADDVNRLLALARESSFSGEEPDAAGLTQALVAVLASPRFIFRPESAESAAGEPYPLVDELSLATRLSYFFWSTTPDEELLALAEAGRLRQELPTQLTRLRQDPRSAQLVENFVGQWLHSRALATTAINDFDIFLQEGGAPGVLEARTKMRELLAMPAAQRSAEQEQQIEALSKVVTEAFAQKRPMLSQRLRKSMQGETELAFAHVLTEDRSVLELIDADYTFLNEELARHYGIEGVQGGEMRKVNLPAASPRGGLLTQGTFLISTSNPGRTSPVKRGIYILENILGTPQAPAPPEVPALEDSAEGGDLTKSTLRATLAAHRKNPRCAACHNAMDPLGLAFEQFNPQGRLRDPASLTGVDISGQLITGESFASVAELKHILATTRARDFYYALSEKLLTYALGRSLTYLDTVIVDNLVTALEANGGRMGVLLDAIVESAPFQRRRAPSPDARLASHPPTLVTPQ